MRCAAVQRIPRPLDLRLAHDPVQVESCLHRASRHRQKRFDQAALLRLVSPRQAKQVTADSWRQIAKASSSKVTAMRRITGASTASS